MDPHDPFHAQQIVIEYARLLERDIAENRHPARIDSLPYGKSTIKSAIETSLTHLSRSGQLTNELRDYFATAYTCLAEYLDVELVTLVTEYRQSADQLAAEPISARDRTSSAAWRTLKDTSALAGEVARGTTAEADKLKKEFDELLSSL
jgi:hypothetical protein